MGKKMKSKVKLVFKDWVDKDGNSVYDKVPGLSLGCFHSGTTFDAKIDLDKDEIKELQKAIKEGFKPVFEIYEEIENE